MASRAFLQTLHNKLKGGNLRSIYLNGLPGRLVTRLDAKQLDHISDGLAHRFLTTLLSTPTFEFKVSFDEIDLNTIPQEIQVKLGVVSKRLDVSQRVSIHLDVPRRVSMSLDVSRCVSMLFKILNTFSG